MKHSILRAAVGFFSALLLLVAAVSALDPSSQAAGSVGGTHALRAPGDLKGKVRKTVVLTHFSGEPLYKVRV